VLNGEDFPAAKPLDPDIPFVYVNKSSWRIEMLGEIEQNEKAPPPYSRFPTAERVGVIDEDDIWLHDCLWREIMSMIEGQKVSVYKFRMRQWENDLHEIRNNPILRRLQRGTVMIPFAKTDESQSSFGAVDDSASLEESRSFSFSFEALWAAFRLGAQIYSYNNLDVFGEDEEGFMGDFWRSSEA
jgi:hypothetical protein